MVVSGLLYVRRQILGAWVYAVIFIGTVIWAFYEVGTTFWGWVPRMAPILVLGLFAALLVPRLMKRRSRVAYAAAAAQLIVLAAGAASMFVPQGVISNTAQLAKAPPVVTDPSDPQNSWKYYGKSTAGTRYAPYQQINRDNVDDLELAWTFRTGEEAIEGSEDQNTPIQVGDSLYLCTPRNKVFALNAETGEQRWMFDPKVESNKVWNRCRGVYTRLLELAYSGDRLARVGDATGRRRPLSILGWNAYPHLNTCCIADLAFVVYQCLAGGSTNVMACAKKAGPDAGRYRAWNDWRRVAFWRTGGGVVERIAWGGSYCVCTMSGVRCAWPSSRVAATTPSNVVYQHYGGLVWFPPTLRLSARTAQHRPT